MNAYMIIKHVVKYFDMEKDDMIITYFITIISISYLEETLSRIICDLMQFNVI